MWFVGFADPAEPVVGLVGRELRANDPAQLFAILDALEAPAPLRQHVMVASRSPGSAAVFVATRGDPKQIGMFSAMMQLAAEDLLGNEPAGDIKMFLLERPDQLTAAPAIAGMGAYVAKRFPHDRNWMTMPAHARARGLWAIGQRERAIVVLEAACASSSDALDHFHLGELLAVELKRPGDGVPHLRRAAELAPDQSQPFTSLAIALAMTGDVDGSIAAAVRATELAPHDARAWANLAQCYDAKHDTSRMREAAQRAQQLEPGEPLTKELLARATS
jgi:tetratricopeptide (TPR) repeat protein